MLDWDWAQVNIRKIHHNHMFKQAVVSQAGATRYSTHIPPVMKIQIQFIIRIIIIEYLSQLLNLVSGSVEVASGF